VKLLFFSQIIYPSTAILYSVRELRRYCQCGHAEEWRIRAITAYAARCVSENQSIRNLG